jgi:hypothetical protein
MKHVTPVTIEKPCFVSVWIQKKRRCVQTCDEGTGNFSLSLSKLRLVYINSSKKSVTTSISVSDEKRFGEVSSSNSQKMRVVVIQIPRTPVRRVMRKESVHDCQPVFINEWSANHTDKRRKACTSLLSQTWLSDLTLCLLINGQCFDECTVYLSATSPNAYTCAKQSLHSFKEIGISWNMEFCRLFLSVFAGRRNHCLPQTSRHPHISSLPFRFAWKMETFRSVCVLLFGYSILSWIY